MTDFIYDIETYPNAFTLNGKFVDAPFCYRFEISDRKNDSRNIVVFMNMLRRDGHRMVGFNNLGFDYPVIHMLYRMGYSDAATLYEKAQSIVGSQDNEKFSHMVYATDRIVDQLDLYKIHHFDNKARATGLKALEFRMRSDVIEDLPFPVGTHLSNEQIDILHEYNWRDITETEKFYLSSVDMIRFREELTAKYSRDFINHNDTKIGKDYFIMKLEEAGVQCYEYNPKTGRTPKQTIRRVIHLKDAILPWVTFREPEFVRVLNWLREQTIAETKGVFDNLTARVDGFEFVFGTGGIHGSVESRVVESDDECVILDLDVSSYYPNLAISNGFYPEHLGRDFCEIYKHLYEQRKGYAKDTAENAMLKLALNGVYGDSNNKFSVFYDPLFTMKITLNGQLLLCMLAESLMQIDSLEMIQINTDGLTIRAPRSEVQLVHYWVTQWEDRTGLQMETAEYSRMFIRDVNNYIAEYTSGKVKRKGAYEYKKAWHQDSSALVVPLVAEQVLLHGASIRDTVTSWPNAMDFMLLAKIPRSSYLTINYGHGDERLQNTTRYCVTKDGGALTKWMPPLAKKPDQWRKISVQSGYKATVCNNVSPMLALDIDYDYYINEVEKLCLTLR